MKNFLKTAVFILTMCLLLSSVGCSFDKAKQIMTNKLTVPDFCGMNYDEVISNENYSDFKFNVQYKKSNSHTEGTIISQDTEAGKTIVKSHPVTLVVCAGAETVELPQLSGLNVQDAKILLTRYGIKFNEIFETNQEIQKNIVITTIPAHGAQISSNDIVDLYISAGPEIIMCTVGDYKNLSLDAAKEVLEKDGFTVGEIIYSDSTSAKDIVIGQSLTAGTKREKGTVVNLTVSTGTPLYEYTLKIKEQLLNLIFEDEYKDMFLTVAVDGVITAETPVFDANIRQGEFEFKIDSHSKDVTAYIRINFVNGESSDAFTCNINMVNKTVKITKSNDLFDHVIGVDS